MSSDNRKWVKDTLSNLADYHNGAAFKSKDWAEDGLPIIRIEQINKPDSETDKYNGLLLPNNYIDTGDLIFSWSATLKVVIWDHGPGALNQHLYKVIPKNKISKSLLRHILDFNMESLSKQSQGSTMKHVTRKELSRYVVEFPSDPAEQDKLAYILDTINQTIEKTEALIGKYQQIKAGLMHDLFTRGITAEGKLRPTREQAPDLYQETPIGWIPMEWEYTNLGGKLNTPPKNGYSPQEIDTWDGVYALGLSCLTQQGFQPLQLKMVPKSTLLSGAKLKNGDFLISRANTPNLVGLCGIYKDVGEDAIYPDLMMKLSLDQSIYPEFLELYLLSAATRIRLTALAVGTSQSMVKLNATSVRNLIIACPSHEEQVLLAEKMQPIVNQINSLISQLNKLKQQKHGLMNDLLTGEVPVKAEEPEADYV